MSEPSRSIRHAADRYVTDQPGIRTWHSFSAGAHYDPSNVVFGPVIGCDEHLVQPRGGFDWHAHRGVVIVSWVLAGTLRHEDDDGGERRVGPGELLAQSTGEGIRHRETNPHETAPLRFVQVTLLLDRPRSVECPTLPVRLGDITIDVLEQGARIGGGFVVQASGDTVRAEEAIVIGGRSLVVGW